MCSAERKSVYNFAFGNLRCRRYEAEPEPSHVRPNASGATCWILDTGRHGVCTAVRNIRLFAFETLPIRPRSYFNRRQTLLNVEVVPSNGFPHQTDIPCFQSINIEMNKTDGKVVNTQFFQAPSTTLCAFHLCHYIKGEVFFKSNIVTPPPCSFTTTCPRVKLRGFCQGH